MGCKQIKIVFQRWMVRINVWGKTILKNRLFWYGIKHGKNITKKWVQSSPILRPSLQHPIAITSSVGNRQGRRSQHSDSRWHSSSTARRRCCHSRRASLAVAWGTPRQARLTRSARCWEDRRGRDSGDEVDHLPAPTDTCKTGNTGLSNTQQLILLHIRYAPTII